MHELGLMTGVLDAVQAAAAQAGALKVTRVDLRVGEMTEVIRDAMDFAFEALRELPEYNLCAEAELVMTILEPRSRCLECGHEFSHSRFEMTCPVCGSVVLELLQGREMDIQSIEVDLPDEADEAAAAVSADEAAAVPEEESEE